MLLFIGAHLDDIEIGCGGYLSYLRKTIGLDRVDIKVVILSEGFEGNKVDISKKRREAFEVNMEKLGVTDYYVIDQRIDTQFYNYKEVIKNDLNKLFKEITRKHEKGECGLPEIFFHSADNHEDHRIVNELVKEIFRPMFVKSLIEYEIPSSNLYNSPGDNFNWYFLYNQEIQEMKNELLDSYKGISLRERGDIRSIDYILKHYKVEIQLN